MALSTGSSSTGIQASGHDSPGESVRDRLVRLSAPAVVAGVAGVGLTLVHFVDPNEPGHYPLCPFYATTGLYCPGCGSMRALHSVTHGDLAGAAARNPLLVAALPLFAWLYYRWVRLRWQGRDLAWQASTWQLTAIVMVVLGFTVARNLPGWTWLSPR